MSRIAKLPSCQEQKKDERRQEREKLEKSKREARGEKTDMKECGRKKVGER